MEIIDHLRRQPRPVDRIDRRQRETAGEGLMGEHRLHQRLGIVEAAVDRDIVDVGAEHRRHLAALDLRHPALGVEHEDVDLGAAGERVDRRRSGVAAGRPDYRQMHVARRQEALEQQAEQLQRDILERQGRAVEQLEQPVALVELDQRRDRGMGEAAIGLAAQRAQSGLIDAVADEGRQHPHRGFDIIQPGERGDLVARQHRPGVGNVKPAVGRQSGERDFLEIERGRRPPGTDISHGGGA
jgi:hypothetical protein